MKKLLRNVWIELSNHNRYKMVAIIFCMFILVWVYGCPIKCNSLLHPGEKIEFDQLQAEVDEFFAAAEHEANDVARQDEFRQYLFSQSLLVASTGSLNWLTVFTSLGTIFGVGATADNVRYRLRFPKA